MIDAKTAENAADLIEKIVANIETVILGKHEVVELVVMSLMARGHILLEDLPGTGKTSLVSALAKSIDCGFNRMQFTPDIMPSDVTGFSIYNQKTRDFEFRPGGVMSNLVLVDEINRASAKTQSALLEAMAERQVTVDAETHVLPDPFMVLATQNPIEQFGTYPLPEAQLDRFLIKLSMGYPKMDEEIKVVLETKAAKAAIAPVATAEQIRQLQDDAEKVNVAPQVARYAVQIVTATRSMKECTCGSSPRGSIALISLARANALIRGRVYVMPDDIKYLAPYVLGHRLILSHEAKVNGREPAAIIASILDSVAVPDFAAGDLQEGFEGFADEGVPVVSKLARDSNISGEQEDSDSLDGLGEEILTPSLGEVLAASGLAGAAAGAAVAASGADSDAGADSAAASGADAGADIADADADSAENPDEASDNENDSACEKDSGTTEVSEDSDADDALTDANEALADLNADGAMDKENAEESLDVLGEFEDDDFSGMSKREKRRAKKRLKRSKHLSPSDYEGVADVTGAADAVDAMGVVDEVDAVSVVDEADAVGVADEAGVADMVDAADATDSADAEDTSDSPDNTEDTKISDADDPKIDNEKKDGTSGSDNNKNGRLSLKDSLPKIQDDMTFTVAESDEDDGEES